MMMMDEEEEDYMIQNAAAAGVLSVTIIHSTSIFDDRDVLLNILPPRFYQDSNDNDDENNDGDTSSSSSRRMISLTDGVCTIVILPATTSTSTPTATTITSYATILLSDEMEIHTISEQSSKMRMVVLPQVYELELMSRTAQSTYHIDSQRPSRILKLNLPGGCSITFTTTRTLQNPTTRRKMIEFMIVGPQQTNNNKNKTTTTTTTTMPAPFLTPQPKPKNNYSSSSRSLGSTNSMKRTLSLPQMIPPLVTTTTTPSQQHQQQRRGYNRIFPTLRTNVLSGNGQYVPFFLNSTTPIPIETDLFVGHLVLVMRPIIPSEDPYWNDQIFSKKKRRVVMQLQGKFKYKPKGTIYAGMEISHPMNLGLIASGLCNIILKMTKSFNPALHYSFGDVSNKEMAHICFPASTFFEQLVITKPNDTPPPMGIDFQEPSEVAKLRKSYKTKIDWNTTDTYSMSFHSMYVDFPSWSVVRLPIGRDIPLQTFWGNASASVVLYELDDSKQEQKRHTLSSKTYLLGVQMCYVGNTTELEQQQLEDGNDVGSDTGTDWSDERSMIEVDVGSTSSTAGLGYMPAFDEDDELHFFDTVETQSMFADDDNDNHVDDDDDDDDDDVGSASSSTVAFSSGIMDNLRATSPHKRVLSVIDTFCPCWIDMFAPKGKYVTLFAFNGKRQRQQRDRPLFRTVEMVEEALGGRQLVEVDARFSTRMSADERTRRIVGLKYAEAYVDTKKHSTVARFEKVVTRFDTKFLRRNDVAPRSLIGIKYGFVARALSDRHWKEERIVLRDGELSFHHIEKSAPHFRISVSSVVQVSVPDEGCQLLLPAFYYLNVETFGRVTYLMFYSEEERGSWMDTLVSLMKHRNISSSSFTNHLFEVDDPMHEFLHNSSMWDLNKRRILNCRRYSFNSHPSNDVPDTLQLAERALKMALSLQPKGPNDADLRAFLDCAAALKDADAYSLDEDERLAFFLNLYHVMIMHAYIVLGPPDTSLKWLSYFNTISYQCSDDVFSLAELEHNIVRAAMSYPSQFLSRFILPKSQYHFALTRPDVRINFALNPGSLSTPTGAVPIYKADILNQQLDRVTRGFLQPTVSIKQRSSSPRDVQIILPRICQWFAEDFGPHGSSSDILIAIEPYFEDEKRKALRPIWNTKRNCYDIGIFNLKYLSYNFECRFLMLDDEPTSTQ
jgi:hypothetical protein